MSAWALGAGGILGAALVITAAVQPRRFAWASRLKARDVCAYIPSWTFFAPNPGVTDARLLWREQLLGGRVGTWREMVPPHPGPWRAVWNPTKRARKAVSDCAPMVVSLAARRRDSNLPMLSLPYLMIVQHLVSLPASPLAAARQFAVVRTQGADDADGLFQLLYVSHWHRLPGVPEDEPLRVTDLPELASG